MGIKKTKEQKEFWHEYNRRVEESSKIKTARNVLKHEDNHKKPVTRRDFLALGAISSAASVVMPGVLGLLARQVRNAKAQEVVCSQGGANLAGSAPFLQVVARGGANWPLKNVWGGRPGNQEDHSDGLSTSDRFKTRLGLSLAGYNQGVTREAGLTFSAVSPLLDGIRRGIKGSNNGAADAVSAAVTNNMNGLVIFGNNNNDTSGNPHSALHLIANARGGGGYTDIAKEGRLGTSLAEGSESPTLRNFTVSNLEGANDLITLGRVTNQFGLSTATASKLLRTVRNISSEQLARFSNQTMIQQVKDLAKCGYINAETVLNPPSQPVVPTADPLAAQAFDVNIQDARDASNLSFADGDVARAASVMTLLMGGHATAGALEMGGYDYHGNNDDNCANRDIFFGTIVGMCFRYAALKNQPLVVHLITDGGISSRDQPGGGTNTANFVDSQSDFGNGGCSIMLVYNPNSRPTTVQKNGGSGQRGAQLGALQTGGTDNNADILVSNNGDGQEWPYAMLLNYLALHNRIGEFASISGGDSQIAGKETQYAVFSPMG